MIKANIPPDEHTFGAVGDTYLDQSTNTLYKCTGVGHPVSDYGFIDVTSFKAEESEYTWEVVAKELEPQNVVFSNVSGPMKTTAADFAKYVTEIVVPEGVTSLSSTTSGIPSGSSSFPLAEFTNLKRLVLPSTISRYGIDMGDSDSNFTFRLDELVLSEGITAIGCTDGLYVPCDKLIIPSSVTSIDVDSFIYGEPSKIIINKPEGSIPGAPWGATNTEIIWTG